MKIVCISDTHTMHNTSRIQIPDGDVLIHAGDITGHGGLKPIIEFSAWLKRQPHKHKIVIAGNHDWCFQNRDRDMSIKEISTAATYLEDSAIVIDGVKFYGSPWQPEFCDWAFNLPRGAALKEKWDMIPNDTDVLITHGPPLNILDWCPGGNVGCSDLRSRVLNMPNLKYHVFGHIHESYGTEKHGNTTFVNASVCTGRYEPINQPIVLELKNE